MSQDKEILVQAPDVINDILANALGHYSLVEMEALVSDGRVLQYENSPEWLRFSQSVWEIYRRYDHVVLQGLCPTADGRTLIAAISLLGDQFLTYGDGKVVKCLAMSPWSRDLAHAGAEGYFHTDLNASPSPPAITGIQCVTPDPGAPNFGYNRIARLNDLLLELCRQRATDAISFMTKQQVELANERSTVIWSGPIVSDNVLRFHPETIRAACARRGKNPPENILLSIHQAAIAVSIPLNLKQGDILLFSNHRTLHYRSECSVRFLNFPMEFETRQVHLLHVNEERQYE